MPEDRCIQSRVLRCFVHGNLRIETLHPERRAEIECIRAARAQSRERIGLQEQLIWIARRGSVILDDDVDFRPRGICQALPQNDLSLPLRQLAAFDFGLEFSLTVLFHHAASGPEHRSIYRRIEQIFFVADAAGAVAGTKLPAGGTPSCACGAVL